MSNEERIYCMEDGRIVSLVASYKDYFSDETFVVLREEKQIFIAKALEFTAHLAPNEGIIKRTASEKINLYRSYFRGNDKMLATSFIDKDDGKRKYYTWCHQRKKFPCPKVSQRNFKCSACKFQNFQPVTNQTIADHLRGYTSNGKEAFYGIYPITPENTVYFLCIDFDKKEWRQEIIPLVEAAENLGLKPLIEISQSGNGGHVWFFFETAITARKVRELGKLLLRSAMLKNPTLSFDSFDRMFPSQDEITPGGFGNLIALPLQGSRVKKGYSRFINKNFELIEDVWGELEKTPKISSNILNRVIKDIQQEIPVQYFKDKKKENQEIMLLEETESKQQIFDNPIQIILENEIILNRSELPDKAVVQLKFLATFHNQSFYIAQRKRLSTHGIPRLISLAHVDESTIRLPRGLKQQVLDLFPQAHVVEKLSQGEKLNVSFNGELHSDQEEALKVLSREDMGILCAGTGFGKTVVAAKLIADKKVNTLILTHNKNLATQWKNQLERFLTIEGDPIEEFTKTGRKRKKDQVGRIYGGQMLRSGLIDIALFQTLTKQENLDKLLNQYGMIIVDEAHHVAAKTFEDVIKMATCRYLYGLTATPKREDHLENILFMRLGSIVHTSAKVIPNHIQQKLFIRFTALGEQEANAAEATIHRNYELMLHSTDRNQQIILDICKNLEEKRHVIVLSRYVKHLSVLKKLLEKTDMDVPIYLLNSKMKSKELREELTNLKQEGRAFVLLTTGSYAGEGFDLPALDTLMLAMPISGKSSLQQYLGRLLRNLDEKNELRVYDYIDYAIPMMYRMYQKRLRTYKNLGYQLYEDEHTALSKSNVLLDDYQSIFNKDLATVQEGVLVLPYLNRVMFNQLTSITNGEKITLILPHSSLVSEESKQIYQERVDKLAMLGYTIKFKKQLSQYFAILDNNIVWMLPSGSENTVALRILSKEIAKRLLDYFGK